MEQISDLLAMRFPKPAGPDGVRPDAFVGVWNELAYFANNAASFGTAKSAKKYILRLLGDLKNTGASDDELLEQLSDSATVYLNCCRTDRSFSSQFLGTTHLSADKVNRKIVRQIYAVAVSLMRKTGLENEAELLPRALLAGMRGGLPELSELYDGLAAESAEK